MKLNIIFTVNLSTQSARWVIYNYLQRPMETLWLFKKKTSRLQSEPNLHPAFHVYPWRNPSSTNISWSQTSEKYKNPHTKPVGDAHLKSRFYFKVEAPTLPLCVCVTSHRSAAVLYALSLSLSVHTGLTSSATCCGNPRPVSTGVLT